MPTTYAIPNGATVFAASTYTGNGVTGQSVVNSGNNTTAISFKPDFVWVKVRSVGATDHYLADSVRGATKYLQSDTTAAEGTNNGITAFNSNGFSVGALGDTNTNGATIVGWQWKAGAGTTSSNTSGSITSTVSVNATAGFSVVTYTGNGTNGSTIGHGLGVAPSMIIVKGRSTTDGWPVYHTSISNTQSLRLNTTAAVVTAGFWNNTTAGSSVFTVGGGSVSETNTTSATYVAYCWAAVAGYSAFGSYTGNGSTDGTFVYLGFRPRYLLLKLTNTAGSWQVKDSSRNTSNVTDLTLYPNLSNAEASDVQVDFLSNGFKLRTATGENANGNTVVYAAFAENPFKYANAR